MSAFVWRGISAPIRQGRYHCWPGHRRARTFPSESASVCVSACESGRVWLAPRPFIRSSGQDKSTCVFHSFLGRCQVSLFRMRSRECSCRGLEHCTFCISVYPFNDFYTARIPALG